MLQNSGNPKNRGIELAYGLLRVFLVALIAFPASAQEKKNETGFLRRQRGILRRIPSPAGSARYSAGWGIRHPLLSQTIKLKAAAVTYSLTQALIQQLYPQALPEESVASEFPISASPSHKCGISLRSSLKAHPANTASACSPGPKHRRLRLPTSPACHMTLSALSRFRWALLPPLVPRIGVRFERVTCRSRPRTELFAC